MRGPHIGAALAALLFAASLLAGVSCADDVDSKPAQVEGQTQATVESVRSGGDRVEVAPMYASYDTPTKAAAAYTGHDTPRPGSASTQFIEGVPVPDGAFIEYPAKHVDYPAKHHHVDKCSKCYPSCGGINQCLLGVCAQDANTCTAIDAPFPNFLVNTNVDGSSTHLVFVDPGSPSVAVVVLTANSDVAGPVRVDVSTLSGVLLDSVVVVGDNCATTACTNCSGLSSARRAVPPCFKVKLPADEDCGVLKVDVTAICRDPCSVDPTDPAACGYTVFVGCSTRNTDFCSFYNRRQAGKLGPNPWAAWADKVAGKKL